MPQIKSFDINFSKYSFHVSFPKQALSICKYKFSFITEILSQIIALNVSPVSFLCFSPLRLQLIIYWIFAYFSFQTLSYDPFSFIFYCAFILSVIYLLFCINPYYILPNLIFIDTLFSLFFCISFLNGINKFSFHFIHFSPHLLLEN